MGEKILLGEKKELDRVGCKGWSFSGMYLKNLSLFSPFLITNKRLTYVKNTAMHLRKIFFPYTGCEHGEGRSDSSTLKSPG